MNTEWMRLIAMIINGRMHDGAAEYKLTAPDGTEVQASSVAALLRVMADKIEGLEIFNSPMAPHTYCGRSAVDILNEASDEELSDARGMHPAEANAMQGKPRDISARYCTVVGDAIVALVGIPDALRQIALAGTPWTVTGSPAHNGVTDVQVLRDDGEGTTWWDFRLAHQEVMMLDEGEPVKFQAFVLVARKDWERAGLVPNDEPEPEPKLHVDPRLQSSQMLPFNELLEDLRTASTASFGTLDSKLARDPQKEDVAALLGFMQGMVRYMVRNDLHHVDQMMNPWYSVALALGSQWGIQSPEVIATFGVTRLDRMAAIDPVDVPPGATAILAPSSGGMN